MWWSCWTSSLKTIGKAELRSKYQESFPQVNTVSCHCSRHKSGCGCLTKAFIAKAHMDFTCILMSCDSQEEFSRRLTDLPKHARDEHKWEGGCCEFHPQRVCTCNKCEDREQIKCDGKPYHTRIKLSCPFHSLAYEIGCHERAAQVKKLVHPVLKRGHSNCVKASHNVLIRFRSKDVALDRLHYELSTNLGLLQANLTYMHEKFPTGTILIAVMYSRAQIYSYMYPPPR